MLYTWNDIPNTSSFLHHNYVTLLRNGGYPWLILVFAPETACKNVCYKNVLL